MLTRNAMIGCVAAAVVLSLPSASFAARRTVISGSFAVNLKGVSPSAVVAIVDTALYQRVTAGGDYLLGGIPLPQNQVVDLELEPFEVFDATTRFVAGTTHGDTPIPAPRIRFLRGVVAGDTGSSVFLAIAATGHHNGFIRSQGRTYMISPDPSSGVNGALRQCYISLPEPARRTRPAFCQTETPDSVCPVPQVPDVESLLRSADAVEYLLRVTLEGTLSFYNLQYYDEDCMCVLRRWNSPTEAAAYLATLVAAACTIYERDLDSKLYLQYCRVWTSTDPYTDVDDDELDDFRDWWNSNMGGTGSTGIISKITGSYSGGVAYLNGLCSSPYSVCDVHGAFPSPVVDLDEDNWDLIVTTHEWGHTCNAIHTMCFDPPIDSCWGENCVPDGCNPYTDPNCECDCAPPSGVYACQVGTIMSYCHVCGGDDNITLHFHPQNIARVSSALSGKSCITTARNPVYVDYCNKYGQWDGSSTNPLPDVDDGVIRGTVGATIYIWGLASGSFIWCTRGGYPIPFPNGWPSGSQGGEQLTPPGAIRFPCTLRRWSGSPGPVTIGKWYEGSVAGPPTGTIDEIHR